MPFTPAAPIVNPKPTFTPASDVLIQKYEAEATSAPKQNFGEKVAEEQIAGAKKIQSSIQAGARDMAKPGIMNKSIGGAKAAFGTITGVAKAALAPVTVAISPIISKAVNIDPSVMERARQKNPDLAAHLDGITQKANEIAEKHPESATLAGDMINTALLALGGNVAKGTVTKQGAVDAVKGLKTAPKEIKTALKPSVEKQAAKDIVKIQEKISPKPTMKEAKLAEKEGRLIKGKEPTMFRGGKPDTVIPSDKVIKSSETIRRNIPNASKMSEPELYTALEKKTSEIATKLKPEMQKVKINPKTVEKINTDWEKLKKQQIELADATEEANVIKLQKQFEEKLQKSGSGTIDDLWETAKEYDASVPENVKKANSLSDLRLQSKKEIWLDNRAILRDAITDAENGLGDAARKPFADMHDMYNARENILSKAKIEKTGKPSKIKKFIKEHPTASSLVGGGTLYGIGKKAGLPLP